MEHLFKLKKDGKTVGYLELLIRTPYGYPVLWFRDLGRLDEGREWHSGNNVQVDSVHPFVTKDKNGKDVFADDEIKALTFWRGSCKEPQAITGKVGWRDETHQWVLYHTPNTPECIELWKLEDIELIEDKSND